MSTADIDRDSTDGSGVPLGKERNAGYSHLPISRLSLQFPPISVTSSVVGLVIVSSVLSSGRALPGNDNDLMHGCPRAQSQDSTSLWM